MSDGATSVVAAARRVDAERIAREAAGMIRARFGDPGEVRGKGVPADALRIHDVVTELDELCEARILERISVLAPHALVLAEEGGVMSPDGAPSSESPADADELWIVDPLDGTINFAHGIPHFCVSVACWRRGAPVAGAIVDPMVGECFSFERDTGTVGAAFVDGAPALPLAPLRPDESVLYVGGGDRRVIEHMPKFRSWRRMGSAALALAWVGVGRVGAYVQYGELHPWDWAAGIPFVEAVGGVVRDHDGRAWPNQLTGTSGVVAAGPGVADAVR